MIWFDEGQKHKNKRLNELVSACVSGHIRPLAAEIGFGDFVGIFLDFNPLALYLRVKGLEAFRKTFIHEKLDFWTLFEKPLLAGFLDASIVECELMALATERACRHYRPKAALHFMEHFPLARAHYKGVRRGAGKILNVAVQHASYNHEKTFLFLEPAIEFHGAPDGQPVPHPDKVCVMGSFAKQLFKDCGYADGDLFVTGSPRYDHLGPSEPIGSTRTESESLNLLILSSLGFTAEIDLLDAVCAAAKGLPRVLLSLRNHPLGRLDLDRRFARYSRQVRTTSGSLADDLALADIVLFTYSTAAEEAFLAGKPVWQWLPIGYDGSALAEVTDIPRFSSVGSLRDALIECRAKRNFRPPTTAAKITVLEQLFYSNDGAAAKRIAHVCKENTKELEFSGV